MHGAIDNTYRRYVLSIMELITAVVCQLPHAPPERLSRHGYYNIHVSVSASALGFTDYIEFLIKILQ